MIRNRAEKADCILEKQANKYEHNSSSNNNHERCVSKEEHCKAGFRKIHLLVENLKVK
jgi:hypothetical protein